MSKKLQLPKARKAFVPVPPPPMMPADQTLEDKPYVVPNCTPERPETKATLEKHQKITALNVAEKPSVAKALVEFLCRNKNQLKKFQTTAQYNPVFEFYYHIRRQPVSMIVTSVLGHIMNYQFPKECKSWSRTSYDQLFDVELEKVVHEKQIDVAQNIKNYAPRCQILILWLDCDREGEAIAYDVIELAKSVNPKIQILRAHFSALTRADIEKACQNLLYPNKHLSDAVQVRQQMDLRIGAALTRFQTLAFRDILGLPQNAPVSYGPCQFPTLGFICQKFSHTTTFLPETYWSVDLKYTIPDDDEPTTPEEEQRVSSINQRHFEPNEEVSGGGGLAEFLQQVQDSRKKNDQNVSVEGEDQEDYIGNMKEGVKHKTDQDQAKQDRKDYLEQRKENMKLHDRRKSSHQSAKQDEVDDDMNDEDREYLRSLQANTTGIGGLNNSNVGGPKQEEPEEGDGDGVEPDAKLQVVEEEEENDFENDQEDNPRPELAPDELFKLKEAAQKALDTIHKPVGLSSEVPVVGLSGAPEEGGAQDQEAAAFLENQVKTIEEGKPKENTPPEPEIEHFVPADELPVQEGKKIVDFKWNRQKVFDRHVALLLLENIKQSDILEVISVVNSYKVKKKPQPMNTLDMQKLASKKLHMSSSKTMEVAEKLYNKGYMSYPRTETNRFAPTINLHTIIRELSINQTQGKWGRYAKDLLNPKKGMYEAPINGKQDDKAHPPIHPVKNPSLNRMDGPERKLFELVARHFLASCSINAKCSNVRVRCRINDEEFTASGQAIVEQGYLEVYSAYEKTGENVLPKSLTVIGATIPMSELDLNLKKSVTAPPRLMTESDLITQMDKNGIGTDATIHEHIKTVQERQYAIQTKSRHFKPTVMGLSLVQAYQAIGVDLHRPHIRGHLESEMKLIASGQKDYKEVMAESIIEFKKIFDKVMWDTQRLKEALRFNMVENSKLPAFQAPSRSHVTNFGMTQQAQFVAGNGVPETQDGSITNTQQTTDFAQNINSFFTQNNTQLNPENIVTQQMTQPAINSMTTPRFGKYGQQFVMKEPKPVNISYEDMKVMKAEDFFKSDHDKLKAVQERKAAEESACSMEEADKTTLSETQFMMCYQCNSSPIRIKESATGYLFCACEGFPRCKLSLFLPKCIKNVMVSDVECKKCAKEERGAVNKIRMEVWTDKIASFDELRGKELQIAMDSSEGIMCVVNDCEDPVYKKLKSLTRMCKKPVKRGTFTDCQRKLPSELKEHYENRKRFDKEDWKSKKGKNGGGKGGFGGGTDFNKNKSSSGPTSSGRWDKKPMEDFNYNERTKSLNNKLTSASLKARRGGNAFAKRKVN